MIVDKIELRSKGYVFENFEEISVSAELDTMARSFEVSMYASTNWKEALDLNDIEIYVGDNLFLTGLVDNLDYSIDQTNKITLSGRSKVSNVIDSSYVGKSQFKNISVEDLLSNILQPYDIEIDCKIAKPYTFKSFEIDSGEAILDVLERISQQSQLIYNESAKGVLVVIQDIQDTNYNLSLKHIKSRQYNVDNTVLNSVVIVRGQGSGVGLKNNSIEGKAVNETVKTYRPLIITHPSVTKESAQKLAEWKLAKQIGQHVSLNYKMIIDGSVPLGVEISIDDDLLDVSGKFIINSVTHSQDTSSGSITSISLVLPESFIKEPIIKEIKIVKSKKAKKAEHPNYNEDAAVII